jgi:hypothetical protein
MGSVRAGRCEPGRVRANTRGAPGLTFGDTALRLIAWSAAPTVIDTCRRLDLESLATGLADRVATD